jgi:hypothetical protein
MGWQPDNQAPFPSIRPGMSLFGRDSVLWHFNLRSICLYCIFIASPIFQPDPIRNGYDIILGSLSRRQKMSSNGLSHKVAIVTGASRGIGRAIALALAAEGAAVLVNYVRDRTAADHVVADIQARGGRATVVKADVSMAEEAAALFAAAEAAYGPVDILVNNAGLAHYAPIGDYDEKDFDHLFNVNVKGPFLMCREAPGGLRTGARSSTSRRR